MVKIEIQNWADHNPRSDYKSMPWLRLEAKFYRSRKLFGMSLATKWTCVALFCIAAEENKGGVIEAELEWLADQIKLPIGDISTALAALSSRKLVVVTYAERTSDERETYVSRTATDAPRSLRNVTERNGTERNETERNERDGVVDPPGAPNPGEMVVVHPRRTRKPAGQAGRGVPVWDAYREAFAQRYGKEPKRNSGVNTAAAQLVDKLGVDDAVKVARFYLTHNGRWYVQNAHMLRYAAKDAEALHTQMEAGYRMTAAEAQHVDQSQSNANAFDAARAILRAREEERAHDTK